MQALFAGVDCQDDRLEATVVGWSKGGSVSVLAHETLWVGRATPNGARRFAPLDMAASAGRQSQARRDDAASARQSQARRDGDRRRRRRPDEGRAGVRRPAPLGANSERLDPPLARVVSGSFRSAAKLWIRARLRGRGLDQPETPGGGVSLFISDTRWGRSSVAMLRPRLRRNARPRNGVTWPDQKVLAPSAPLI